MSTMSKTKLFIGFAFVLFTACGDGKQNKCESMCDKMCGVEGPGEPNPAVSLCLSDCLNDCE